MLLSGCGSNDGGTNNENQGNENTDKTSPEENNTSQTYPEGDILKLAWDSLGEEDIHFTIDPSGGQFDITVERYEGQPVNQIIRLTQETEAAVYDLVADIFNQSINLYDYGYPYSEENSPSRSVTLSFSVNRELVFETIYPLSMILLSSILPINDISGN